MLNYIIIALIVWPIIGYLSAFVCGAIVATKQMSKGQPVDEATMNNIFKECDVIFGKRPDGWLSGGLYDLYTLFAWPMGIVVTRNVINKSDQ